MAAKSSCISELKSGARQDMNYSFFIFLDIVADRQTRGGSNTGNEKHSFSRKRLLPS